MSIHGIIHGVRTFSHQLDGDYVDQLHYLVTSNMLLVASSFSAYKAFGGDALDCLVPARFPGSWQAVVFSFFCFNRLKISVLKNFS